MNRFGQSGGFPAESAISTAPTPWPTLSSRGHARGAGGARLLGEEHRRPSVAARPEAGLDGERDGPRADVDGRVAEEARALVPERGDDRAAEGPRLGEPGRVARALEAAEEVD